MINRQKILLLGISILLLVLSGCTSETYQKDDPQESITEITINFEDVTHKRSDTSLRMYKALAATHNGVIYEIETSCVNDEQSAKDIILRVDNDIKKVNDFFTELELVAPTVIITSRNNLDGEDLQYSYHHDNTIATTIEFIASGEYLYALIGAMLKNDIPWINHGLAGQFGSNPISDDEIRAYLSKNNNIDVLDFFGARYYKTVPENDWPHAIAITEAFVDYYIDAYGKSSFIDYIKSGEKTDLVKEKNEWLDYIGSQKRYTNDTSIIFQNFEFSEDPNYDFKIDSMYASYLIKTNDEENYVLSSVEKLKYFLTKNKLAIQEVKTLFSNNITDKDLIEFDTIPIYNINEAEYRIDGHADPYNDIIVIHGPLLEYAHIHEYVHVITPINKDSSWDHDIYEEYRYFVEGIACYITSSVNNEYSYNRTDFDTYETYNPEQIWTEKMHKNESGIIGTFDEHNQYFVNKYLEYYTSHANDFTEFSDFSMKLYSDSLSYALLELQEKYPSTKIKNYNYYALYESFVGYLANEYSLEQVIQAIDNYDIQAIFGKSFEELHAEWKEYLFES